MIRFACSSCKSVMEAPETKAGTNVSCPKCRQVLRVPAATPVAARPVAPAAPRPVAAPIQAAPKQPVPVVAVPVVPQSQGARPTPIGNGPTDPVGHLAEYAKKLTPRHAAIAGAAIIGLVVLVGLAKMITGGPAQRPADPDQYAEGEFAPPTPYQRPPRKSTDELLDDLKSDSMDTRIKAVQALDRSDSIHKSAVQPLIAILKDKTDSASSTMMRKLSARLLGKVGPAAEPATEELRIALGDPNQEVRANALEALGKIGKVAAVMDMLGDAKLQLKAADVLSHMGDKAKPAVPTLVELMQRVESDQRFLVATAIVRIEPANQAPVPILIAGLKDINDTVRRGSARALGLMGAHGRGGLDALQFAVDMDSNGDVKSEAEEAIRKINGK